MKRNILIFGASLGGKRLLNVLSKDEQVLAFLDNDPAKHNESLKGYPILSPQQGFQLDYDAVIIASQSYSQIASQLVEKGLDKNKIEVADPAILRGDYELSSNRLGCVIMLGTGLLALAALTLFSLL